MAVRVKKLARELQTSPQVVISVLEELGYDRYRNPADMVPDSAVSKLRVRASELKREGRWSTALPSSRPVSSVASPRPASPSVEDQRDRLSNALDRPIEQVVGIAPNEADSVKASLAEASRAVKAEQAALHEQSRRLADRAARLQEQADALRAERDEIQRERDDLRAQKERLLGELDEAQKHLEARAADLDAIEAGGIPLTRLLDERGLIGADEHARALASLAQARLLDSLVGRLRVVDAEPVRRVVKSRLVLAEGPVEGVEGLANIAAVHVAPDRAEIPTAERLTAMRERLWQELLLCGVRRMRLIGLDALEQRLLRAKVDPRLELTLLPAVPRDAASARDDVASSDLIALRNIDLSQHAQAVYDAASVPVLVLRGAGLRALFSDLLRGLAKL